MAVNATTTASYIRVGHFAVEFEFGGSSRILDRHSFSLNGFSTSVSLIHSGEPAGVSLSFSQNQLFPPPGVSSPYATSSSSVISISVSSWVAVGLYPIAVTGTSEPLGVPQSVIVHSTQLTLQVVSAKDFTIAIAHSSLSIQPGTSTTATVTVSSFSGFSSAVGLTTNSPPGCL